MAKCLLARSVQEHDLVFDTSALQIQLKFEPHILRERSRSLVKLAQPND
jgi:hypothetical protein